MNRPHRPPLVEIAPGVERGGRRVLALAEGRVNGAVGWVLLCLECGRQSVTAAWKLRRGRAWACHHCMPARVPARRGEREPTPDTPADGNERLAQILAWRAEVPPVSLRGVARRLGISGARVSQILARARGREEKC